MIFTRVEISTWTFPLCMADTKFKQIHPRVFINFVLEVFGLVFVNSRQIPLLSFSLVYFGLNRIF
jgi:hypothetical protein